MFVALSLFVSYCRHWFYNTPYYTIILSIVFLSQDKSISALHLAVEYGRLDMIKLLVANGADLNLICNGETAEKLAEQRQKEHPKRTKTPALLRSLREQQTKEPSSPNDRVVLK
jgi:hypothetical protein